MNIKHKIFPIILCLAFFCPLFASAEEKPADNMQIVVDKIRADKKLFIAANMQLTETEAQKFWPVYEKFQNELLTLRGRTIKLVDNYAASYGSMTNDVAGQLIDEYMDINASRLKLRQAYLPKFRNALPEVKVARYYQIENKIEAALMYELAASIPIIGTK